MKRVTYMSSFARSLSRAEVDELGAYSARRNAEEGITGVLMTLHGMFFQIIEGDDRAVEDLYARVLHDDRHTDIVCLRTETDIEHRLFPDWSMSVIDLGDATGEVVEPLKLLLDRMSDAQNIIERYTQPAVSRIMMQGLNPLDLPLRKVDRLVLFTDMVAFSEVSERLPIEDLSTLVSAYLETCSSGIARRGGEVTKFLGDGVMAYFRADEADEALQACVDVNLELRRKRESATALSSLRLLHSGFGLALGSVLEGSIGSSVKMDYTIIGEPVNTAARLEALTRQLHKPVLMTDSVVEAANRQWEPRFEGVFDVGRGMPTQVYSLPMNGHATPDMRAAVRQQLDLLRPS